uniref:Ig-like domain-containing protein n=1 Tax=Sphaeramia orbicularis TaxID=375764 RepID=A0A673C9U2_9TELE
MSVFTVITVLFLSWTSGSVPESQTVEVQPGENITLSCINKAGQTTVTDWFRVTNRTKASCISSMFEHDETASFCDGFGKEKYEMMVNPSKISLHIKDLDFSDSGLYFCGFYLNGHTVISETTYLNVQGNGSDKDANIRTQDDPDGIKILIIAVLGGLSVSGVLPVVTIALAVKIRKRQTAVNEELQQERNKVNPCNYSYFQNVPSDDLTYATINCQGKPKRKRRPASGREVESNVVYAATR